MNPPPLPTPPAVWSAPTSPYPAHATSFAHPSLMSHPSSSSSSSFSFGDNGKGKARATDYIPSHMDIDLEEHESAAGGAVPGVGTGGGRGAGAGEGRTLCVRHQMMADQGVNQKLQKSLDSLPLAERAEITSLWSTFSSSGHPKRKLILEGLLTMCCFSQLSHIQESLHLLIRVDPFSLFPREVSIRTLGFLDAISLGRAAQVSKSWKNLADDDLLWRRMCGQHIERKCVKCGWGLPLLERRRLRVEVEGGVGGEMHRHAEGPVGGEGGAQGEERRQEEEVGVEAFSNLGTAAGPQHATAPMPYIPLPGAPNPPPAPGPSTITPMPSLKRTHTAQSTDHDDEDDDDSVPAPAGPSDSPLRKKRKCAGEVSSSDGEHLAVSRATAAAGKSAVENGKGKGKGKGKEQGRKPWKTVYCERLIVERNWRKGRCEIRTLRGHTNGVMCLQFHHNLPTPNYPVLITGSYDRTARVWNLETGECVRVLTGHTRAIRALQFDGVMLITGSMDRTLRIWNWRTGHCVRVLEGHTDGIVCLHYDKEVLASGSADSTIKIWNFKSSDCFTLRGHREWVNSVQLWDGKTTAPDIDVVAAPAASTAEKAKFLFSGSDDGTIKLWDLIERTCIRTFTGHVGQVQSVKLIIVDREPENEEPDYNHSSRNHFVAEQGSAAVCSSPYLPNFHTANVGIPSSEAPEGSVQAATFARASEMPNGGYDMTAYQRDPNAEIEAKAVVTTDNEEAQAKPEEKKSSLDSSMLELIGEDKQALLVSGALDNMVKIWDVETGREKRTLFGHIEGVWATDVDTLRLASGSHDRTIKIWDRETGKTNVMLTGHRGAVTSLQLSDDLLVSGSDDGEVRVWDFGPSVTA